MQLQKNKHFGTKVLTCRCVVSDSHCLWATAFSHKKILSQNCRKELCSHNLSSGGHCLVLCVNGDLIWHEDSLSDNSELKIYWTSGRYLSTYPVTSTKWEKERQRKTCLRDRERYGLDSASRSVWEIKNKSQQKPVGEDLQGHERERKRGNGGSEESKEENDASSTVKWAAAPVRIMELRHKVAKK